ncbi:MAG: HAMP domain-containing histidine kinase [Deltaproteobacteria bacterium]|nr:MAG: HAMP domain-containing histidine kinase [Deltaproteobacteria bacterium]
MDTTPYARRTAFETLRRKVPRGDQLRHDEDRIRRELIELRGVAAAKDDLVSLMVHDLRSPLFGQVALLHLVLDELGPEASQVRRDIEEALRISDRVFDSLEDVLRVRFLEEGKLPVHRDPVDLRALITQALETLHGVARRRRVALTKQIEGKEIAWVDRKLVQRSVQNLLSNALRHTAAGGDVLVLARCAAAALDIEVADRGPGVRDDLKQRLFDDFGLLERPQAEAGVGFGLGLRLVKLVAECHGGAVSVRDRPGGGSVFRLRLQARTAS